MVASTARSGQDEPAQSGKDFHFLVRKVGEVGIFVGFLLQRVRRHYQGQRLGFTLWVRGLDGLVLRAIAS